MMSFLPGALVWFQVERGCASRKTDGAWKNATVSKLSDDDMVQLIDDQGQPWSCKSSECFLQNNHAQNIQARLANTNEAS